MKKEKNTVSLQAGLITYMWVLFVSFVIGCIVEFNYWGFNPLYLLRNFVILSILSGGGVLTRNQMGTTEPGVVVKDEITTA